MNQPYFTAVMLRDSYIRQIDFLEIESAITGNDNMSDLKRTYQALALNEKFLTNDQVVAQETFEKIAYKPRIRKGKSLPKKQT